MTRLRIETGDLLLSGHEYIILTVAFAPDKLVEVYVSKDCTPESLAQRLEWLAVKVRAVAKLDNPQAHQDPK